MNLKIDVVDESGKSIVHLSGEIDTYTAPDLRTALLPLTKTEGELVEVDLAKVNYMDSTGLGVFISALKSTKENDSSMQLVNIQDSVRRLFRITGLDEVITIKDGIRGGSE
ncbi:STAS domain-containing protein [Lentibacillus sediminis]|uniref:STAS domain-containing protein n=1 Tax=Lentibacillus sediminis TaxID=1940529 RepID=UPI000C1C2ECB|nr:STAS domain-containing protein [Lentibacillus sediminis]